ncbi:SsgA family sporulation/cell division regulator [Amycolatopsis acidiphila]|uniref:SsgA family sporulation/cell division regulator n=1 Tax=Amycolatopsis acidiphila TaxID=715473 RepID=A0A558AKE7_9PSEU|nr:SsgA family sporulation/cell division regulator [Amycolatopsis acidiphila]TVT24740.1 SsgA family sporulation/cell division regulator [Amycolatopsis acidiphila]UIJ62708.1 SsgA family sporulation/cell division regulator [Amycolatopsis acidiphila]GHG63707.1 sporulation protein SsgA [Amycolatopsis acidiphila]
MRTDVVEQHQFVTLNGCETPVFSRWTYIAGDPYVVNLAFRTERGRWIEWCFARDLLVEGLVEPAGLGDVRVRPDLAFSGELLVIELESPDGYAIVEMRREDVEQFVDGTREVVPLGAESELLDIDAFIAQIIEV